MPSRSVGKAIGEARKKPAAEPLHKRIVLLFPNLSGVITPLQHLPGRLAAPSDAISMRSPEPQHRSKYRSLAVIRNAHPSRFLGATTPLPPYRRLTHRGTSISIARTLLGSRRNHGL